MRLPQLLLIEPEGRFAETLREAARSAKWAFQQPGSLKGCLALLQSDGPAILVVRVGKDLVHDLALVEQVKWRHPETACVILADQDDLALLGLIWDLGADCVLSPPWSAKELTEIVANIMQTANRVD
jgi:DNA-binding NarL/FixJ family response regulator